MYGLPHRSDWWLILKGRVDTWTSKQSRRLLASLIAGSQFSITNIPSNSKPTPPDTVVQETCPAPIYEKNEKNRL
jgi:hypothetical protein